MAFIDLAIGKPCFLEMTVYIAGINKTAFGLCIAPALENSEAGMGPGGSVKLYTMSVKLPGNLGVL